MTDEQNIQDRVKAARARGFLGFYSSVASSALLTRLQELGTEFESLILDCSRIAAKMTESDAGHGIFRRYFPVSWANWHRLLKPVPNLYIGPNSAACAHCGKDLLAGENAALSNIILWENVTTGLIEKVYPCCKGDCDHILKARFDAAHYVDRHTEMHTFTNPGLFILKLCQRLRRVNDGSRFTGEALDDYLNILTAAFRKVARPLSPEEDRTMQRLIEVGSIHFV